MHTQPKPTKLLIFFPLHSVRKLRRSRRERKKKAQIEEDRRMNEEHFFTMSCKRQFLILTCVPRSQGKRWDDGPRIRNRTLPRKRLALLHIDGLCQIGPGCWKGKLCFFIKNVGCSYTCHVMDGIVCEDIP
ncbi:hypothetical protein CEXT_669291 [Caerostris extrusa]|uniref:Uncharacterized protein n=1 Tax=Caerostris extrusa TaxID=172846 RepID=A0AAV4RUF4_CAEEX|nr:hypothetical protein CEXT_669291 [Caerostris extrusa]